MKELKEVALDCLVSYVKEHNFCLKHASEAFFVLPLLFKEKHSLAQKYLDYVLSHQTKEGDFDFGQLEFDDGKCGVSEFLFASEQLLCKLELCSPELLKGIQKASSFLLQHVDELYLLYYEYSAKGKLTFKAKKNAYLLSCLSSLSDKLNELGQTKEADALYMVLAKLQLGFERYFYHKSKGVLLSRFYPQMRKYKLANSLYSLKLLTLYPLDLSLRNKLLSQELAEIMKKEKTRDILVILSALKASRPEQFAKECEKQKNILSHFPVSLNIRKKSYAIYKSLFRNAPLQTITVKRGKSELDLIDYNDPSTALEVLLLLEDDE
ncbi:hypothetical protein H6501_04355 [Candidatus Woesearchaeota archaeon]|nr:hypothetical protein [Nanoarchaeota archaeon]MCB9370803.1 hypothetical protein [Candidatus Woesearchaeota archaeon]USN43903.1 MAG: hypothetical protein H6500_05955 [Candidatus Woesearchaeota archaeon]